MFCLVNTMNTIEEFLIWIFLSSFGSCTEICEISQTILFSSSRITTRYVVLNPPCCVTQTTVTFICKPHLKLGVQLNVSTDEM